LGVEGEFFDDVQLIAVAHWRIQESRLKSHGIHHERIPLPTANRMAGAAWLQVRGMIFSVHVDGALQAELPVFEHDRIFILCDAVYRPVEGPVEDDAGGLAMEARIIVALEFRGRLGSRFRKFAAAIKAWSRGGAAPAAVRSGT